MLSGVVGLQDITDSFTYPTERDDWLRTVGIGGALVVLGFLLMPVILAYGYLVGVVRASLAGTAEPPVFDDREALLGDGLIGIVVDYVRISPPPPVGASRYIATPIPIKAWLIGLVYMLVPLLVAGVTVGGFVLALTFGYVAAAAMVNFAAEDSLGAAFDVGTLSDVLLAADFAISWLVSVLVFLVLGTVAGALSTVPVVGSVLAAFPTFYGMVGVADILARGFEAARQTTEGADV